MATSNPQYEYSTYFYLRRGILFALVALALMCTAPYWWTFSTEIRSFRDITVGKHPVVGVDPFAIISTNGNMEPVAFMWTFPLVLAVIAWIRLPRTKLAITTFHDAAYERARDNDVSRRKTFVVWLLVSLILGGMLSCYDFGVPRAQYTQWTGLDGQVHHSLVATVYNATNTLYSAFGLTAFYIICRGEATLTRYDPLDEIAAIRDILDVAFVVGATLPIALINGIQSGFAMLIGVVGTLIGHALLFALLKPIYPVSVNADLVKESAR